MFVKFAKVVGSGRMTGCQEIHGSGGDTIPSRCSMMLALGYCILNPVGAAGGTGSARSVTPMTSFPVAYAPMSSPFLPAPLAGEDGCSLKSSTESKDWATKSGFALTLLDPQEFEKSGEYKLKSQSTDLLLCIPGLDRRRMGNPWPSVSMAIARAR